MSKYRKLWPYGLCYLATPFTRFPRGHEMAFIEASEIAGELMKEGVNVFCPVTHSHPIARYGKISAIEHEFWMSKNRPFMLRSDALIVAEMEGWQESQGMAEEEQFFKGANKPIFHLNPETMELKE